MTDIRNFSIVAHVDHGKSTLADRLLEATGTIQPGSGNQVLDTMELERERGITIKLNPARMDYRWQGKSYQLNLIDTPGHVDFGYEVSRALAAVEGVLLLVDASQGVQAQTLTNLNQARKLNLAIIPVVNKIDLPTAQIETTTAQLSELLDCTRDSICYVSAKTGQGISDLLKTIIYRIPPPQSSQKALRALVFDSFFDSFLGVIAYVKVVDGEISVKQRLVTATGAKEFVAEGLGFLKIKRLPTDRLASGEIGYLATGLKTVKDCRVGETIFAAGQETKRLLGYQTPRPMVYASIFAETSQETQLTEGLEKLQLSDASLEFQLTRSQALGFGYTVGCLGLLHLEIVKERLEREFDLNLLVTTPKVAYQNTSGGWAEPWVELEIVAPSQFYGAISGLAAGRRSEFVDLQYLGDRIICKLRLPLSEAIVDFYDRLKSVSSGYASMDYRLIGYRPVDLVEIDFLLNGEKIDALSTRFVRDRSERYGRQMVERLKEKIPRQNIAIAIQAAIGGKIIARADISPYRKDVTAKLYGGDVTRKRKLLEKQKKGKKKMRLIGKVEVPSSVFIDILKAS